MDGECGLDGPSGGRYIAVSDTPLYRNEVRVTLTDDPAAGREAPTGAKREAPARVTRRRARTRARLLDAAFDLFAHRGFGQCSIEAVCEAAGFTRGAFYSNFAGLDELFFALYDDRARLIAGQLAGALAETRDLPDFSVAALVGRVADVLLLDRAWLLVKTEFLLHAARRPDVAEALARHRAVLREAVAARLRELSRHLPLPPLLGDVDAAARAVVAVYDGVTVQLLLDGDAEAARTWLKHLLTALLTAPVRTEG
jgi:AcrR family transcriptional regulator